MLRFDRAGVDLATRLVELDGSPRHLEPQAFDLLAYLLTHRDRVVSKSELLDEVWGDQFVSDAALTTRIKEIRRAVGDDGARQAIVRNYRGRGYRFVAEVDGEPPSETTAPESPPLVTSLRGRNDDIAGVMSLLESTPVVTLVGPGGVGKTALALEVSRQVRRRHADPPVVVSLAPVGDADNVVHVLRSAAALPETGPTEASLIAAVADLDALLVIDNCEHVIDEASRLVGAIAEAAGTVRILATSRERLGLRSEQLWPVAPLERIAARALVLERARSVQPDWATDDTARVDRLVDLVDRLPLAIEMAAARLPSIGLADLVDLLDDRLDLLSSPNRAIEDRHRTLPSLIEWSENLLDPSARRLLTDLSVFAGPVGAADIASVAGAHPAELATGPLADLVEQSLVVADTRHQPTRYHLLETVKACVAPNRDPSTDDGHADHIAAALTRADEMLRTPDEPLAVERIELLTAEIRAAHRWCRANDPDRAGAMLRSLLHYAHERQWTEPADWSRDLLAVGSDLELAETAAAACLAADASNRGDYQRARSFADQARRSTDPVIVASAIDTLTNVGLYTGDLDAAHSHAAALLELAERNADPVTWTLGLLGRVLASVYAGRIDEARARLDDTPRPASLSPTNAAWIAYAEGEVHAGAHRVAEAVEWFDKAVELGASVNNRFVVGVAQVSALAARARSGDIVDSMAAFAPVLAQYRRSRSLTHGITALRNLIDLLVREERDEPAMVLLGALSAPATKATYGLESDLLDDARRAAERRHPSADIDRWTQRGAAHDPIWALDFAIATVSGTEPA